MKRINGSAYPGFEFISWTIANPFQIQMFVFFRGLASIAKGITDTLLACQCAQFFNTMSKFVCLSTLNAIPTVLS